MSASRSIAIIRALRTRASLSSSRPDRPSASTRKKVTVTLSTGVTRKSGFFLSAAALSGATLVIASTSPTSSRAICVCASGTGTAWMRLIGER